MMEANPDMNGLPLPELAVGIDHDVRSKEIVSRKICFSGRLTKVYVAVEQLSSICVVAFDDDVCPSRVTTDISSAKPSVLANLEVNRPLVARGWSVVERSNVAG
jgi:hypothetical protein